MAKQIQRAFPRRSCNESLLLTHELSHQPQDPATQKSSSELHHRQAPNRRHSKQNTFNLHRLPTHILLLSFTILLTCLAPVASASTIYIPEQMVETPKNLAPPAPEKPEDPRSALSRLAKSGPILVDLSPAPKVVNGNDWMLASIAEDLKRRKRQVGGDEGSQTSSSTSKSATSTKTGSQASETAKASTTLTKASSTSSKASPTASIVVAEDIASKPLPQIFDNGFSGNLTDSCLAFMNDMLANEVFKACLPFSLLLQNSNSFFQTTRSVLLISRLLDYTCAADPQTCTPLLSNLATNLTSTASCGNDLTNGNPLIHQAQLGLLSYRPLYTASCLRNARTSSYCFADAVTNKTSPSDGYVYYLPLNMSIPTTATPTCSQCLRDTLAVFSGSDGGSTGSGKSANQALAYTYTPAAQLVNSQCGPTFVNTTLSVPVSSALRTSMVPSLTGVFALALLVGSWLL